MASATVNVSAVTLCDRERSLLINVEHFDENGDVIDTEKDYAWNIEVFGNGDVQIFRDHQHMEVNVLALLDQAHL